MSEVNLLAQLREAIGEGPVDPPPPLERELWARIEAWFPASPAQRTGVVQESDLLVVGEPRRRRTPGPVIALAVFGVVLALGGLFLWLGPLLPAEDTIPLGTIPDPDQRGVDPAGEISLPQGHHPVAMAVGEGQLYVVTVTAPPGDGEPPSEVAVVVAVALPSGELRWRTELDGAPSLIEASAEAVWVAHHRTGALTRLDPDTGIVVGSSLLELPFDFGSGPDRRVLIPNDLEVAFGSVWVSSARGAVARVDAGSSRVLDMIPITDGDSGVLIESLASSDRYLWIAAGVAGLYRLDPTDQTLVRLELERLQHTAGAVAFHARKLFVAGNQLVRSGDGTFALDDGLYRMSTDSAVTAVDEMALDFYGSATVPAVAVTLAEVDGQLWVIGSGGSMWPVDGARAGLGSVRVLDRFEAAWFGAAGDLLWLMDPGAGTLFPVSSVDLLMLGMHTESGNGPTVRWRHRGVGMDDSTLADQGRIVVADQTVVFVADGYGGGSETRTVIAIASATGEVIWARSDLEGSGPVFLQAIVNGRLVIGSGESVVAVDPGSGQTEWVGALPPGYRLTSGIAGGDLLILVASATREGDVQPPLVRAVDPANGDTRWEAFLDDGTDAIWHPPALEDDLLVVVSTLSHPGSAPGNVAHGLDPRTGSVRWRAELGGEQAFHFDPTLIHNDVVLVPTPEGIVGVDAVDGARLRQWAGVRPLLVTEDGRLLGYTTTGAGVDIVEMVPSADAITSLGLLPAPTLRLWGATVNGGRLFVVTSNAIYGMELEDGSVAWRWEPAAPIVDLASFSPEFIAVPTADRSVVGLTLPR